LVTFVVFDLHLCQMGRVYDAELTQESSGCVTEREGAMDARERAELILRYSEGADAVSAALDGATDSELDAREHPKSGRRVRSPIIWPPPSSDRRYGCGSSSPRTTP
jgi:hypothetical protein